MTLANKVTQFNANSDLVNQIVHGNAATIVETEGGPVRSLAKLMADNDAAINKAGLLGQVQLARAGAEAARDAALIQPGVYATEAIGRAAVADGVAFKVQGAGDVAAFEYRRINGDGSVLIASYPSASAAIAPSRTNFLQPGKNLFDKGAVTYSNYLTETGVLAANPTYNVSDFIAVTPGQTYHANAQGMRFTCFYDRNKVVIPGGSDIGLNPFVAPAGAAFVRVTMFNVDMDVFQLERGNVATPYESFKYLLQLKSGVAIVPSAAALPDGWLPGGKIGNGAVSPEKTTFLSVGKNKFNKHTVTPGKYIISNGQFGDNPGYDTSDYIPVRPGPYKCNTTGIRFSCNYDANMNVVAGGYNGEISVDSLIIPEGVAFIRIAVEHNSEALQLEEGTAVTGYEPYGLSFKTDQNAPVRVTPPATSFLPIGKNRFNKATVTRGKYLSAGGVEAANDAYSYSDFIAVKPGPYILNAAVLRMSCFYNDKKAVVPGGYDGAPIDRFTVPAGVAFIKITVPRDSTHTVQLEEGEVATPYQDYRYELRADDGTPIYVEGAGEDSPAAAQEAPVVATTQYVPNGKEIALYLENVVRDYQAVKGHVGITLTEGKETGEATKFVPAAHQVGGAFNGNAVVVGKDFDPIVGAVGKWFQVKVSDAAKTTPVNILNIGDSFTGRMTWANVINATPAAAGITYSGNRTANSTNQVVKCEGQGGWTMASYFTVDNAGYLSPFMQPVNAYKHYGPTAFWVDANSAAPSYNATLFLGIRDQFDAATGRKKAPAVNDVMSEGGGYIVWNGAAWAPITLATLGGFAFNFGKYRATWGIARPNILHVLLGTNDFYGADATTFPATYAAYKARYEQLIASVKADSPACKIIVGVPVSSARQGEYGTLTTERVKRAMWMLAKNLVADFDGREADGIYLLDYHSVVHRVYGFDTTAEKPMADYAGPDTYKYTSDITHCGEAGFTQMGNAYMGLIQYLR